MNTMMATEMVAVADLKPPSRNTRTHPEFQIAELARAIEKFGQTRPVVIDETNTVLAGNGLVMAYKRLGRDEIAAYRVSGLSKADKTKLMLSDNRIYALGLDDNVAILDTIRGLGDFDIPGYDPDILKGLALDTSAVTEGALGGYGVLPAAAVTEARGRSEDSQPPSAAESGEPPPEGLAEDETICPSCGHVFVR